MCVLVLPLTGDAVQQVVLAGLLVLDRRRTTAEGLHGDSRGRTEVFQHGRDPLAAGKAACVQNVSLEVRSHWRPEGGAGGGLGVWRGQDTDPLRTGSAGAVGDHLGVRVLLTDGELHHVGHLQHTASPSGSDGPPAPPPRGGGEGAKSGKKLEDSHLVVIVGRFWKTRETGSNIWRTSR